MKTYRTVLTLLAAAIGLAGASFLAPNLPATAQQAEPPVQPGVQNFGPRIQPQGGRAQRASRLQPGRAQGGQPPKTKVVAQHGDWRITCEEARKGKDGKVVRPCGMVQTGVNTKRKNLAITLVLVKAQQNGKTATMMRVMAPIGVFLPTGVALEIDGAAVGRVPFTRCLPQLCVAFAEASPPTLEKLKKGAKAKFLIYEAPGLGLSIDLSLKGFTAALTALHKL